MIDQYLLFSPKLRLFQWCQDIKGILGLIYLNRGVEVQTSEFGSLKVRDAILDSIINTWQFENSIKD